MVNHVHPLRTELSNNLEQGIRQEIDHECCWKVDKRLALKLALALLDGPREDRIFYAKKLVDVLSYRIDFAARMVSDRL